MEADSAAVERLLEDYAGGDSELHIRGLSISEHV